MGRGDATMRQTGGRSRVVMPDAHHAQGMLQGRDWGRESILHNRAGQRDGVAGQWQGPLRCASPVMCLLHVEG